MCEQDYRSTLERGDEIEADFYRLKAQEWACEPDTARQRIEAALSRPEPTPAEDLQRYIPDIVKNAMLTAWNEICADTGCHPDDIEQNFEGRRRHLGFEPKHWARIAGENVARTLERGGYRPAPAAEVTGERFIDVVFDGPPSHKSGRFVEVENSNGQSIRAGKWIDRGNGLWALRISHPSPDAGRVPEGPMTDLEAARYIAHTHPLTQQSDEKPEDFVLRIVHAYDNTKSASPAHDEVRG